MAVFAPGMTRPKLPCDNVAPAGEPPQRLLHLPQRKPPTRRRVGAEEGDVGPRPADQEGRQRLVDFFEERIGEADRQRDAERVAITRYILGADPPLLLGDAYSDGTALALQLIEPFGTDSARLHFGSGQIAEPPEQVGRLIGVARPAFFQQTLQLEFQEFDRPRIEQLPKLFGAKQLGQELFIQRQRLRSSLGQRRIALVHVLADVIEDQGGGERRGTLGVDHNGADLPRPNRTHQLTQAIHVKDVAQAFAVGFDQDRELGVLAGHLQQVMAALALLPERSALTRPTPR